AHPYPKSQKRVAAIGKHSETNARMGRERYSRTAATMATTQKTGITIQATVHPFRAFLGAAFRFPAYCAPGGGGKTIRQDAHQPTLLGVGRHRSRGANRAWRASSCAVHKASQGRATFAPPA